MTKKLWITHEKFMQFLSVLTIKSAYGVTVTNLYGKLSCLRASAESIMSMKDYLKIWTDIAKSNQHDEDNYTGWGRRDQYLWQGLENEFNHLCREISIVERRGEISIAKDDDKVQLKRIKLIMRI